MLQSPTHPGTQEEHVLAPWGQGWPLLLSARHPRPWPHEMPQGSTGHSGDMQTGTPRLWVRPCIPERAPGDRAGVPALPPTALGPGSLLGLSFLVYKMGITPTSWALEGTK